MALTIITIVVFRIQKLFYPDIFLITVDALRPDHLTCYGYQRKTSPNMDNLSQQGTLFLNCYSTCPITLQSTVGLLTGRYLGNDKYIPNWENILDKEFTTLAEYLKKFGYYSAALLDNISYEEGRGFEQGFDDFFVTPPTDAKDLTERALIFLQNRRHRNRPLFIWVHYMDTHPPYNFREEYMKMFEGDRLYNNNDKILKLKPEGLLQSEFRKKWSSGGYIPWVAFRKDRFSLNYYIAGYDSAICYTDLYIGELLRHIKNNAIIILTADHGESLGEHNVYFNHGENIYNEQLHIPLIIKDKRCFKEGRVISMAISIIDIVPTILSRINPLWFFFNRKHFDGIDLKLILKNDTSPRKYIYSYVLYPHPSPSFWSILDVKRNIKYIFCSEMNKEELFILPDETSNLINETHSDIPVFKKELSENLKQWKKIYPVRSDKNSRRVSIDEHRIDILRSLGYVQ